MELLITEDLEPLPLRNLNTKFERPEGLLNSNYKNVVKCNLYHSKSNSIFGIKQRLKGRQYQQFSTSTATLVKVSVFVLALAFFLPSMFAQREAVIEPDERRLVVVPLEDGHDLRPQVAGLTCSKRHISNNFATLLLTDDEIAKSKSFFKNNILKSVPNKHSTDFDLNRS